MFASLVPRDPKWIASLGNLLETFLLLKNTIHDVNLGLGYIVGDSLTRWLWSTLCVVIGCVYMLLSQL